jgi:hypothetical protein
MRILLEILHIIRVRVERIYMNFSDFFILYAIKNHVYRICSLLEVMRWMDGI